MRAMILSAGLGTRLHPITLTIPKALVPIHGKPLLEYQLRWLEQHGFDQIAINAHYLAHQIRDFLNDFKVKTAMHIFYSEEPDLLDTGGGIKKMLEFFPGDDPILVQNVDVATSMDCRKLMLHHTRSNALATLAINRNKTDRPLAFSKDLDFLGRAESALAAKFYNYCFCGIQVIHPELFRQKKEDKFYSIDVFCEAAKVTGSVKGFDISKDYWRDIGTLGDLDALHRDIFDGKLENFGDKKRVVK